MAVVLIAIAFGNISSLDFTLTPALRHNSDINVGKNKHPFNLIEHDDISFPLKYSAKELTCPC